ncbi:class I SAM-dependent methyltransferase [Mesorhizobium sp. M7A.F.Ca.CA.001.09.2.1]|uniref:Methyltransferase domain-containing protein n=2 Tax=Mesorhizobium TaxID=68287 RepID=A0AB38TJG2_9HYPH|nr:MULTISPECIES: class I SAM-dependent methyltransferase [Mesorhizobium]RUY35824.1 class I SAM-dependent methyltransferase [Mesorhizobium sp. M7A.F.Ca.CA.001.13.2.1]MDF3217309.1 methyltransferase domain-containing protein [Mesorhizobium ciceri]RUY63377.1 class I SAM-dependent methyltransferase [Mesorhizobium sp. M7A.F.Ca.CA.001.13.1.1]RUY64823.1 class I SAM-dependent methyltransferase [Mesorhizobium sp. M7A.F.Ca.CA.001.05.1.1]RUY76218.1 class I SAM-dependent methyltransferase [Mesorhizobium sp
MSELFDSYRSIYDETVQGSIRFSGLKHDFFLKAKAEFLRRVVVERGLGPDGSGVRALDVGCGVGVLHPFLKGAFASLDGCDISPDSILRAREENPGVMYKVCSSLTLPYDNGVFDLAFASCVVHHVPPASWLAFVREMRRVLRPGGVACIIEHNPYNPLTRLAVFRCPFDRDAVLLSAAKTASLLQMTGFTNIRSEHFLLLPSGRPFARKVERMLARLPLGAQYVSSARA